MGGGGDGDGGGSSEACSALDCGLSADRETSLLAFVSCLKKGKQTRWKPAAQGVGVRVETPRWLITEEPAGHNADPKHTHTNTHKHILQVEHFYEHSGIFYDFVDIDQMHRSDA